MADDLHRMVGEMNGKLDSLTTSLQRYIDAHERRHEDIDDKIESAHADINQAKGAKAAVYASAGFVSAAVGLVVALGERLFRGHP